MSKRAVWPLGRIGVDIPAEPAPERTLADVFERCERLYGSVRALDSAHSKPPVQMTFAELMAEAKAFGAGMATLGMEPGTRVALFSDNRPRWIICDLGLLLTGLVEVPRGCDTSDQEFDYILRHSGADAVILQDRRLYQRLASAGILSNLRSVILMDDVLPEAVDRNQVTTMAAILEAGKGNIRLFDERRNLLKPGHLATIVYTSGTTGGPKGVMLTHRNLSSQMDSVDVGFGEVISPGAQVLSILPTWHAYERAAEYFLLNLGCTINYTDKRYLKLDLERVRPHVFPCVPRIWETVYEAIRDRLAKASPIRQKLFQLFYGLGLRYVKARRIARGWQIRRVMHEPSMGTVISSSIQEVLLRPIFYLGDRLVFSKLRAAVSGGRLHAAVSGGGSFAAYLDDFFEVVGVPIVNGYGLTETSPVLTCRRIDWNVRGSVGLPIRGTEIQVRSERGEILPRGSSGLIFARGPQIMMGYYNNPEATNEVLESETGWLNTGDLGFVSLDGDVVITGRAKDTIVLSSGENVEPEPIENVARRSPLILQIVVLGQDQKNLGALVVPHMAALAGALGLSADADGADVLAHAKAARTILDDISKALKQDGGFKPSEFISKVALVAEPFSEENGILTQTMKIRRNKVTERYAEKIKQLFI